MFRRRVAADGDQPALLVKRGDKFVSRSPGTRSPPMPAALPRRWCKLGVKPGDRVVLVSENRYEWIVLDLAIQIGPRHRRGRAQHAHRSANRLSNHRQRREDRDRLRARAGRRSWPPWPTRLPADVQYLSLDPAPTSRSAAAPSDCWPTSKRRSTDADGQGVEAAGARKRPSPTIWPRSSTPRARPASPRA